MHVAISQLTHGLRHPVVWSHRGRRRRDFSRDRRFVSSQVFPGFIFPRRSRTLESRRRTRVVFKRHLDCSILDNWTGYRWMQLNWTY